MTQNNKRIRYANPLNVIHKRKRHIVFYNDIGLVRIIKMAGQPICKTARIESCIERSMTRYAGVADGKKYEMNWKEDGTWHVWWQDTWEQPKVFPTLEQALIGINEWQP